METARKHGDHNLLRDVAIYRDMWHIDDPDQPSGKGRRAGPAGRNSTGATSTHASPDKEAASSTPAKPGRPTVIGRKTRRPAWRRRTPQPWRKGTRNGRHGRNIIEQLARCADAMTRTLDSWDTGTLIVLAVTLTVLAGVTGRATTGGGLIRQILWITVTAILTLIAVATVWTIASRYLPIPELETLLRNLAGHQPLFRSLDTAARILRW